MKKVLFVAHGGSVQAWYRCAIPANELNLDWIGMVEGPPNNGGVMIAGNIANIPNVNDYEAVVIQLASGDEWLESVKGWRKSGIKVYYECDDFIQGIHNIKDHRFKSAYAPKRVKEYVKVMKACDGIICSTEYLADQYKKYNENTFVCRNYLPTKLYNVLEREPNKKDIVTIGWSGGTGHLQSFKSWYPQLLDNLLAFEQTRFISVGAKYGDDIEKIIPDRSLSIPWTNIENYPFVIKSFDISIAPSHVSKYFRSKSDLRWLESSAVGVPCIVNPITYPDAEDRVTGMVAETPEEFSLKLEELILNPELRKEIGSNAREYVRENRDISVGASNWSQIFS